MGKQYMKSCAKQVNYIKLATDYSCQLLHKPIPKGAVYGRKGNMFFYLTDFQQFQGKKNALYLYAYNATESELDIKDFRAPRWYRKTIRASYTRELFDKNVTIPSKFYKEISEFVLSHVDIYNHKVENILMFHDGKGIGPSGMPKSPCSRYDAKHMPPAEAAANEHTFKSKTGETLVLIGKEWEDALEVSYKGKLYERTGEENILYNSRRKDWNNSKTGTDTPCWNATFKVMPQVHSKKEKPQKPAWQNPAEKSIPINNSPYVPTGEGKPKYKLKNGKSA